MRLGIVLVTLLSAGVASAQPVEEELPPAGKLFMEGRALLDAGKASEACAKFEESYKLDATAAGTMLNLGLCNEQLTKLATALKWFRRAANSALENNLADIEGAAKEKTSALATRVATLKIEVSAPLGRVVTLDGNKVEEVELGRIELDAGPHVVQLTAPNAPTVTRELEMIDGKPERVELVTAVPPKPKRYEVIDRGASARRLSYLLGGAGAALVIGSGAVGLFGKRAYDEGETPAEWNSAKNWVRYGGTSMFVAGLGALTYATVIRLRAPGKQRREVVAPILTPQQIGFGFARSF